MAHERLNRGIFVKTSNPSRAPVGVRNLAASAGIDVMLANLERRRA